MSSILPEDIIKASCKMEGQCINNEPIVTFSSDEVLKLLDERDKKWEKRLAEAIKESEKNAEKRLADTIAENHETKVRSTFKDYNSSFAFLQEENENLKKTIEEHAFIFTTLGHNPGEVSNVSANDSKNNNESRARLIFPELEKTKKLAPSDIINICKLGKRDYETAHRIMDMAEKVYPGECKHNTSKISGASRHWLIHKDHFGFED